MNRVSRAALSGCLGLIATLSGFAGSTTQTVTFDAIPNQILGVSPFPIAAEASSGLAVSFVSTTPLVCKNADDLVMLLTAGTCSITASQGGNATFAAAMVTRSFMVSQANPSGSFMAAAGNPFAAHPFSVVVGDFNGDGIQDLATANGDGTVTAFLGNGSGGFSVASGSPVSLGTDPNLVSTSLAIGDFNGDGIQDLAVAGYDSDGNSGTVTVLLGNGSGGFTVAAGSPITVGTLAYSVAVGDFNGDGIQDLAVANEVDNTISVLLGNGSGGFTAAPGSPVAVAFPRSVAVGDFNRDGIQDLAVANFAANSVTVLLGNGSGGFTAATGSPITVETLPVSVAVGDFNGDGIQDLATANLSSNNVTVLLGNGSGGFSAATDSPFAVGTGPNSVVVGDFNGDGIQDLATANASSNNVTILLGNGSGGFTTMTGSPLATGQVPSYVAVGDFNSDGILDLAVANASDSNLSVLLGDVVGHTPQTITFGTQSNVTFGVSPYTISATSSSGLGLSFASTTSSTCTTSGNTVTIASGGLCAIVASQPGNATYAAAATVTQSFTVGPALQTISFAALSNVALGTAPFALSATASSNLPVSFTSSTTSVCTTSGAGGATLTILTLGTCTVVASQPGDSSYFMATPFTRSFMVVQFSPCDLKQTGSITVADVQLIINEALGLAPAVNDLNGDGKVNVIDVQIEINAALGLGCAAT
jgi:hypothetical protein